MNQFSIKIDHVQAIAQHDLPEIAKQLKLAAAQCEDIKKHLSLPKGSCDARLNQVIVQLEEEGSDTTKLSDSLCQIVQLYEGTEKRIVQATEINPVITEQEDIASILEEADIKKDWLDYVWEFVKGFFAGDFIQETDSVAVLLGQITSSFVPLVDIRDVIANLANEDYLFAGISVVGLVPALGDVTKAGSKIGKFIVKNIDKAPQIAEVLSFMVKNFPNVTKELAKSDEFVEAVKQLSKIDTSKLSQNEIEVINEALGLAGLSEYAIKGNKALDSIDSVSHWFDTTRINIANGPTRFSPSNNAGLQHVIDRHFSIGKNAGQFTISVDELKNILGRKEVINTPGIPSVVSGQYTRIVDVGEVVGTIKPSIPEVGGQSTTWITIITDIKGNLITTYPCPAP